MKIAIIGGYPEHLLLPGFDRSNPPKGHFMTWFAQMVRHFEGRPDIDVHWLSLTRSVDQPQLIEHMGQHFHLLPMSKPGHRLTTFYRADLRHLSDCLKRIQPDVVHGWGSEDVGGLAASFFDGPSLVSIQGLLRYCLCKSLKKIPGETWEEWRQGVSLEVTPHLLAHTVVELIVLSRAQHLVVESAWAARQLQANWPRREAIVIEYGPDDYCFTREWQPDPFRPSVVFAGTLQPRKGIRDLFKAFAHPSLAGVDLVLIGECGNWVDTLRAKASPNVKWLGRKTPWETTDLMAKSWCLAVPTRADTGPMVAKEARVIGMPVIGSPHAGLIQYIEPGQNGFIVENGDIPALIDAIVHITSDYERCRRMGAWKHSEHRELLSPKRTVDNLIDLYRRLSEESSPAL